MARPFSASWLSDLCIHFGLKAYELAHYLGMDAGLLSRQTSGQGSLGPAASQALAPFVVGVAHTAAVLPPLLALSPPEADPLEARLDYCQHRPTALSPALSARYHLLRLQAEAPAAEAAALATLLPAALPPT